MKNAYTFQTFFNHVLNSHKDNADYLFTNELLKMDQGVTKKSEEDLRVFWKWDESKNHLLDNENAIPEGSTKEAEQDKRKEALWSAANKELSNYRAATIDSDVLNHEDGSDAYKIAIENAMTRVNAWIPTNANPAASARSTRINNGQSIILNSKFQNPLFNTSKCLPTNMKIRITLSKNKDEFLLLCNNDAGYSIVLEDCYLNVTYYRVRDEILQILEQELTKQPAPYFISRPEIIVRPVTQNSRIIRMSDIFTEALPPYSFFALQRSLDYEGQKKTNPFIFYPFKTFQFYRNGIPYFTDPLEVATITKIQKSDDDAYGDYAYRDFGEYMRQLYRTIGKDNTGNCLIDSSNFHLNFMAAISFGADRPSLAEKHLNLQEKASTHIEIDLGIDEVPEDLILIVYAVFDRQVQIDSHRMVRI
ncbi:MAG: hypothetical protein GY816_04250, partial [Cytophagales bacterium]|nr:hypothetical protein [Cytophagales bacterium]